VARATYSKNSIPSSIKPQYLRYQLIEQYSQLKIDKGTLIEGRGADCELKISVPPSW